MPQKILCINCGDNNAGIADNLKCTKCGYEYFRDNATGLHYPKKMPCKQCGKQSASITSKLTCDSCGAKYARTSMGWLETKPYGKAETFFFIRSDTSSFIFGEGLMFLLLFLDALYTMTLYTHFYSRPDFYLPLIIAVLLGADCIRRLSNARKNFGKLACISESRGEPTRAVARGRPQVMQAAVESRPTVTSKKEKQRAEKVVVKKRRIWIWLGAIANFLFGSEDEKIEPCGTYSAIDGLFTLAVFAVGLYYLAMFFLFVVAAVIAFSGNVASGYGESYESVFCLLGGGILCAIIVIPYLISEEKLERGY